MKKQKPPQVKKKKVLVKKTVQKKAALKNVRKVSSRRRLAVKKAVTSVELLGKLAGVVTHYFPKVRSAAIKLKLALKVGQAIRFKGYTSDFTQVLTSMQIDRLPVDSAKKGAEIGALVDSRVRRRDKVYVES